MGKFGRPHRSRRREGLLRQEKRPASAPAQHCRKYLFPRASFGGGRRRATPMNDRPRVHDFDWVLLAIAGAITVVGLLEIYSSTHASAMAGMQWKQLMWIGIGVA